METSGDPMGSNKHGFQDAMTVPTGWNMSSRNLCRLLENFGIPPKSSFHRLGSKDPTTSAFTHRTSQSSTFSRLQLSRPGTAPESSGAPGWLPFDLPLEQPLRRAPSKKSHPIWLLVSKRKEVARGENKMHEGNQSHIQVILDKERMLSLCATQALTRSSLKTPHVKAHGDP